MIDTSVIIVNWNGKKYLHDCFDSLLRQTYKNFETIFVDNGSNDDSVYFVRQNFPSVKIIELEKNTGFCFANNIGIKRALENPEAKHIIVLNNDTKLDEKYVEELVVCAGRHPNAGAIQPKVLNFFQKDKIDCAGITIARDGTAHNRGYEESEDKYDDETEIFGANGTASLFLRAALEKTKMRDGEYFDNDFFAYYEDTDLAWRVRLAGFSAYFCPKALVWHVHSASMGKSSLFKAYYLHRNYFLTVFKNYPAVIMIKALGWRTVSYIQLFFSIFGKAKKTREFTAGSGKGRVASAILKAWANVIFALPSIIRKRRNIQRAKVAGKREIRLWLKRYRENP